jgi:hypothetical protein
MLNALSATALVVGVLAVWRVTHLLWGEDGPGDLFVRLRRLAGEGFAGRLLDCFYCLSLWVALPFACVLGADWAERALLWLGLSGGAVLLGRATAPRSPAAPPPAVWHEEPAPGAPHQEEQEDVLLR